MCFVGEKKRLSLCVGCWGKSMRRRRYRCGSEGVGCPKGSRRHARMRAKAQHSLDTILKHGNSDTADQPTDNGSTSRSKMRNRGLAEQRKESRMLMPCRSQERMMIATKASASAAATAAKSRFGAEMNRPRVGEMLVALLCWEPKPDETRTVDGAGTEQCWDRRNRRAVGRVG